MIRIIAVVVFLVIAVVVLLGLAIQAMGTVLLWAAAAFAGSLVSVELAGRLWERMNRHHEGPTHHLRGH